MSLYKIGKEIQEIKSRLEKLESQSVYGKQVVYCSCEQELATKELDEKTLDDNRVLASISFNWGRSRLKDCEWREGYITLLSDGSYEGKMNLRCNKGSFFSCDSMETSFEILINNTVLTVIDTPTKSVGGASDKDITYSGINASVRDSFNQITSANRVKSGYCS